MFQNCSWLHNYMDILKIINIHFKRVHCMVYELYLKKAVAK